jgi:amino acid transporter
MAISVTAVSVVPSAELARSDKPLVDVVTRAAPWFPARVYTAIALFAVTNTALLNFIMGSRMAYGMARQGLLPRALGRVHATRRTPWVAILALLVVVLALALVGNISSLARATSVLLLLVFAVVNASLIILKRRPDEPRGAFEIPAVIPALGVIVCAVMLVHAERAELLIAGVMLAGIAALYLVLAPRGEAVAGIGD